MMLGDRVIASGWTSDVGDLLETVHASLRPEDIREVHDLGEASRAIDRYFDGDLVAIDAVEVEQHSGPFIEQAWAVLRAIPAGSPVTYAELAAKLGRPDAVRAAGNGCAYNSAALFVPCHRVVRTGGALGGFRWGLPVKRWLLDHESGADSHAALTRLSADSQK
ncbi:MAG TPA: methylated-DNA--[protein]-cysteine S-methyltransferase [Acidimicrobiales bacterium]|nr:methylated-DNA--[protein]-cysteine S-methyltransferase [Acidimicrobiales bacterium]